MFVACCFSAFLLFLFCFSFFAFDVSDCRGAAPVGVLHYHEVVDIEDRDVDCGFHIAAPAELRHLAEGAPGGGKNFRQDENQADADDVGEEAGPALARGGFAAVAEKVILAVEYVDECVHNANIQSIMRPRNRPRANFSRRGILPDGSVIFAAKQKS